VLFVETGDPCPAEVLRGEHYQHVGRYDWHTRFAGGEQMGEGQALARGVDKPSIGLKFAARLAVGKPVRGLINCRCGMADTMVRPIGRLMPALSEKTCVRER
jgi:hypothetical protein